MFTRLFPCRSLSRALIVAIAGLALGACVAVRVPKLPTGELPAHWRNAPALGEKPDLTGWWRHFGDPRLNALVETALKDNPDVVQAVWNLRAARALEGAAGDKFKPSLAFRTDEQSNTANTANYFQFGFDATWEIGLFGRRGANGHIARANTGVAEADLQSARVSLVAEVVREYLQLRAAQREEALLDAAARTSKRKLALVRVRERLQLASQIDVEQASTQAEEAEEQLADPRAAIAKAAQALALLLGKSEPDPAWLASGSPPHLEDVDVVSVPANLLRTRPEIHYAEMQVVKAAGELGVAKADLYPSLTLGGGLSYSARIVGRTSLGKANGIGGIGPFINIPLFNWGRLRAQRRARDDQLKAALTAYRKAVLAGAAQVEDALATLHAADQRLKHADAATHATHRSLLLSEKLHALDEADQTNLATAELALGHQQLAQVQARLQRGLAYVALYKALGGAPLPPVDTADVTATAARADGS